MENYAFMRSPTYGIIEDESKRLFESGSFVETFETYKELKRIQQKESVEVRETALNKTSEANKKYLDKTVYRLISEGRVSALASEIYEDIVTFREITSENENALFLFNLDLMRSPEIDAFEELFNKLENVSSHSDYIAQMDRIKAKLNKIPVKKIFAELRLLGLLENKLIRSVIPKYLAVHPEDRLTWLHYRVWTAMRTLKSTEKKYAMAFLDIREESIRFVFPSSLGESSTLKDFHLCARGLSEVSDYLPLTQIQDLVEGLLQTLRTWLDKKLLDAIEAEELLLTPQTLVQAELLNEIRGAMEYAKGFEDLESFKNGLSTVIALMDDNIGNSSIDCLDGSLYNLLSGNLCDQVIIGMLNSVDLNSAIPEEVSSILPLYISVLSRTARGRLDFWNDAAYILWDGSMSGEVADIERYCYDKF